MENAKVGFGKLFTAEILIIIGGFVGLVPKELWYLGIAFIVVDIVAFFMNLKGLKLMAKDLEGYNKAYKFALAGIIFDIVTIILCLVFKSNSQVGTIVNNTSKALTGVIEYGIAYLVLKTSVEYLTSKGNTELAKYANTTKNLLTAAYCISILLDLFISTNGQTWVALVAILAALVAIVFLLVGQIRYISFLKKMNNTL